MEDATDVLKNPQTDSQWRRAGKILFIAAVLGVALLATRLHSYLLFHTVSELVSVAVTAGIFLLAWSARRYMSNGFLFFIGVAYLFVGVIDMLHAVTYKGVGIFPDATANLPTQLWIAGRYLQAGCL